MLTRRESLGVLLGGLAARALAQQPTFSTGVRVVDLLVSARDKSGRFIADLTQDEFEVREDNRPQEIRYFAKQTDIGVTLGMLVDTSQSQRAVMEEERNAAKEFFWEVLRPDKDNAFVIRFDVEVELTQDSTSSFKALDKALESLEIPQAGRRGGQGGGRGGGRGGAGGGVGTLLYDSVFLASDEVLKGKEGRKAVILLSDGEDHGSKESLNTAIETAQRTDTVIYSIRMGGGSGARPSPIVFGGGGRRRGGGGPQRAPVALGGNGEKVMRRMAEETGGRYFDVTGKQRLDQVFTDIEQELRNQYSIGYVSDRGGEGFRAIDVRTKRKGVTLQARQGYYAKA